jgi:hypothetical protein
MNLVNLSAVVEHAAWRTGVYVTNLADRRVVQAPPESPNRVGDLTDLATINQPRTIMLKVGYAF